MVEPTDIEKKSLEAHVELCAERYKLLETKLETVEQGVYNQRHGTKSFSNCERNGRKKQ